MNITSKILRTSRKTDTFLITICLIISLISIICLFVICEKFSITKRIFLVQAVASTIGLTTAFFMSNLDYHKIANLWKIYIPISLFFVFLTFVIGIQRGTADDKAWLKLPLGMSFQPSELLKICFILSFSLHLSSIIKRVNKFKNVILLCIHGAIPIVLVHLQGDDGTALMFLFIFIIMFFSSGISWKYILTAISTCLLSLPALWFVMSQDQKNRVLITMHPENDQFGSGYQQFHGLISIGNGGFSGKGLFNTDYKFVPEVQNDFIFSFIGQVFGFAGSLIVLSLLLILTSRILIISLKSTDCLGRFICVGVFALISSQVFFNIGMNLSILPVIGVTLPFLSSGGSSVITVYVGIGLVLSVLAYNNKILFYKYKSLR